MSPPLPPPQPTLLPPFLFFRFSPDSPPMYIWTTLLINLDYCFCFEGCREMTLTRAPLRPCVFHCKVGKLESTLHHGFYPVNLLHISRTPFPKSTFGGLLLNMYLEGMKIRQPEDFVTLQFQEKNL